MITLRILLLIAILQIGAILYLKNQKIRKQRILEKEFGNEIQQYQDKVFTK